MALARGGVCALDSCVWAQAGPRKQQRDRPEYVGLDFGDYEQQQQQQQQQLPRGSGRGSPVPAARPAAAGGFGTPAPVSAAARAAYASPAVMSAGSERMPSDDAGALRAAALRMMLWLWVQACPVTAAAAVVADTAATYAPDTAAMRCC